MTLPAIPDLPIPPLGFDIPTMIHSPVVHFAIVLPIVILLLEIYNLFTRRKSISVFSFILLALTIVIFVAAWLTGKVDGKNTLDLLTTEGKETLKEHKLIGTYLVYGTGVLLLFKIFAISLKGWKSTLLYILILIGFIAGTLYQGKEGGELVFEHGANNARVQALSDELFDLKDEIEDLKAQKQETAPAKEEETKPAPAVEETPKEETPKTESAPEKAVESEKSEEKPAAETKPESKEAPTTTEEKEEAPAAVEENHDKGETAPENNETHE